MELYKALHNVLDSYGRQLIEKPILVNYLADFHAFEVKATRRVLTTLLQMGYGEKIYQLDQQNTPDRLLKIKSYSIELTHEGYQQIHVNYVMDSICYALGWMAMPPEEPTQEQITSVPSPLMALISRWFILRVETSTWVPLLNKGCMRPLTRSHRFRPQ